MKIKGYIITIVLILVGIYSGISLYQQATATSYVNGEINIENEFKRESFNYTNSSVAFYPGENATSYIFETDLLKVEGFDAEKKDYVVTLNGDPVLDVEFTAGAVNAQYTKCFYGTDGSVAHQGTLNVVIRFLTGKTQLVLSVKDATSATYFEQFFTDYGIRLIVTEIL